MPAHAVTETETETRARARAPTVAVAVARVARAAAAARARGVPVDFGVGRSARRRRYAAEAHLRSVRRRYPRCLPCCRRWRVVVCATYRCDNNKGQERGWCNARSEMQGVECGVVMSELN